MTTYDPDYFEEKFPNLFEEIKNGTRSTSVDALRTNKKEAEKVAEKEGGSGPMVVDFLRLCDEEDEALDIINYMEEEGKIDSKYASRLRSQLTNEGLRSFGSGRDPGDYDEGQ